MADAVRIRLCSALTVEHAGVTLTGHDLGSRKARTLFALLAAERGRLVPLDRITAALWPATPPHHPAANVATLVSRTRARLGAEVIIGGGSSYGLATGCPTDLDEAAALTDEAGARSRAGEPALAGASARRALDLLGPGPALPDEGDADWVVRVRQEADALRQAARHLLAEAATSTDPSEAAAAAAEAAAVDPYDERALRDLMRARVAEGSPAAALAAYGELAARLREDLGVDPSTPTTRLHLAILREEPLPLEHSRPVSSARRPSLVGREVEVAALDRSWAAAGARSGGLVLLEGQGGIGKTRLLDAVADLAESSGGLVLRGRCHPAERSLFLQPYADALRPTLLGLGSADLAGVLREHAAPWALLVPELAELVDASREPRATPVVERRRAYDAVAAVLRRLSWRQPVLLTVDDLQDAGAASVDLLGYLAGRLSGDQVLLVGAVRTEHAATVERLSDRATRVRLGALPRAAVDELASVAGLSDRAADVMARTAGHSLSVVECLRALAAGDAGVPESLATGVLARVRRLDGDVQELVSAAAVLHGRLDPRLLGALVGAPELAAVQHCEELTRVGLFQRVGTHYEFVNDLTQECVDTSLPPALAAAYHRRAADLLSDQPEAMAAHAAAAGDRARAAQGWLLAGEAAMARSAVEDATELFDRSLSSADDPALRARALLMRASAREAAMEYVAGLADIEEALTLSRLAADRRLEMTALRSLGGDIPVALHRPMSDIGGHLEAGLRLASGLGDRRAEADFTTRLVVLESSRLQLTTALARAETGLARARASASDAAVPLALDGLKTVLGYVGDAERLSEVTDELIPRLRGSHSVWLLQWALFDAALVPAASGDWPAARELVAEALEFNRRSGFVAYAGYLRAHLGWIERLAGNLDRAEEIGRRAVAETSPIDHPWWYAAAAGLQAATLLEQGEQDGAVRLARHGLHAAGPDAPEAFRLRCVAASAIDLDDPAGDSAYDAARAMLGAISCPPGRAWVVGADAYLSVSRAALRRGDPEQAAAALRPLEEALTGSAWGSIRERVADELAQISSATS